MGKHYGLSNTRLHRTWKNMRQRCFNPNNPNYKECGAKGITICDEWVNDFKAFYDWAMSHGYSDELSIKRIDLDKDYSPDNCVWVTKSEQSRSKRCKIFVTINGEEKSLKKVAKECGVSYATLLSRYKKGGSENVLQGLC